MLFVSRVFYCVCVLFRVYLGLNMVLCSKCVFCIVCLTLYFFVVVVGLFVCGVFALRGDLCVVWCVVMPWLCCIVFICVVCCLYCVFVVVCVLLLFVLCVVCGVFIYICI